MRIIVLKARQLGISTITEAIMFNCSFIYPHSFGLVVAHEGDASEHLFNMTRLYWDEWPFKRLYTPKYHSKRELAWIDTGSSIRVATASNVATGRSRTINFLHASEVGFWDEPETLMLGMRQTIPQAPGSMIVMESTANGVGTWFYNEWMAAEEEDTEYVPLFFPWHLHPEYTASYNQLPPFPLGHLDAEERLLVKIGVDDDHIAWRRWAVKNLTGGKVEDFHQEYPTTPMEAFITAGSNVFPYDQLQECYEPAPGARGRIVADASVGKMKFQADPMGPLLIFRHPSKDRDWGQYFVSGDPCYGQGADSACIQVINRRMYEQVAVWHGKINPVNFADELVKLAKYYNDAEVSTEVEGPGYATIGRIMSLDYPNVWQHRNPDRVPGKTTQMYGWSTNSRRKDWMISEVQRLVADRSLLIHDRRTFEQMRSYVTLPEPAGGYGPADSTGHDDTVMALSIGIVCARTEGPISPYESRELQDDIEPMPEWAEWGSSYVS